MARTYQAVRAIYRAGAFIPQEPCDLPEGAAVELIIHRPGIYPPEITDPEEQARLLKLVTERMMRNPIPADAPRFTRDELHERR
jgi:predicted DNA-binding antitoxin AbrB/MazE fold protein